MIELTIPTYSKEALEEKVAEVSKKFKVTYEIEYSEKKEVGKTSIMAPVGNSFQKMPVPVYGYDVVITFDAFEKFINTGFSYLGCIKDDGVVTVHSNGEYDLSTLEEEIKTFPCHECGRKIVRNIIHAFREDATGNVKVFGSTCAKKRFGVNINALLAKFENIKSGIQGQFDDDIMSDPFGGGGSRYVYTKSETFIRLCYNEIFTYGYVSKSKAALDENKISTADFILSQCVRLLTKETYDQFIAECDRIEFNYDDFLAKAETIVADMDGEFGYNMKSVFEHIKEGVIIPRIAGFVAYLVFLYAQAKKVEMRDKTEWNTDYSDLAAGDKIKKLRVKIIDKHSFESYYGTTCIYTMRGMDDNIKYKWFTGKNYDIGTDLLVTSCAIKELQDDPKYGKAVVITRCRTKIV